MKEKEIGKVIHYFDKAMVAVVRLSGSIALGDAIRISKGEKESEAKIVSMQINHEPVEKGKKDDEVAIKVEEATKEGAVVYKIEE